MRTLSNVFYCLSPPKGGIVKLWVVNIEERGVDMRGKVKWFNNEKGYGFIECDDLEDIFVHYSAITKEGYKTLKEGDIVDFKLIETSKGLQAVDVTSTQLTTV